MTVNSPYDTLVTSPKLFDSETKTTTMNSQDTHRVDPREPSPKGFKLSSIIAHVGALSLATAVLICGAPAKALLAEYQTAVTNELSLISYYTFDQDNAADGRGTNSGTLIGSPSFATGTGGFGKAVVLGGTSWVNLGVVEDFAFTNDDNGTVEAWVQAGNLTGAGCIFANRDGYSRWDIHMEQNKLGIGMWNGGAYFPTIPIPNASTNWHHLRSGL